MNLYPWLMKPYKNIIYQYQIKKAHHALLIKTEKGIGVSNLIWYISKWLLCLKPIGINCCNECHGCKLMVARNHPDWHYLKNNTFNINDIRIINEKIFKHPQQGGNKIIFLSNIENLTPYAVNAFLKTLEEPPKNTWFFLISYNHVNLHLTLNSRCLLYKIFIPKEKDSIKWLKKKTFKKNRSCLTALRINQGSPISAKKFINEEVWIERENFYKCLFNAFKNKNMLKILKILNKKNSTIKINWICSLLFDSIKFNFSKEKYLTNIDQIALIQFISYNYTNSILDISIRTWMQCRYRLLNIPGINYELLLTEQLLRWEQILHFVLLT
ncbi:MAG: DNA polymerase III subunit delta' [Buchnera aphidicola (Brevicoryne brassicae)]|uniref:DNA polymerase III subunit delta' n=1 Tax=Buchnera aphidicola (Brevicoryne brassicae) TaxID=911343 RepID=A0AAJ5TX55_9GAMM|nr:DNA polymerase III subunit delta' C-terminal domain-containing protein [Buchnera aphidicola]QCI19914.1 DNA polymerase III subunit delta' [Buchnera aphidicola (Brevicoryne brassicae)]WAI18737.1 MAG: DNA polymerase III subunit delta' [Buchnera aphidicola (Brevicoryne brassicae)]